jgi:hypothetical protein
MTLVWTIIAAWLALQLPLGMLVGKSIKFGMGGPVVDNATRWRTRHLVPAR